MEIGALTQNDHDAAAKALKKPWPTQKKRQVAMRESWILTMDRSG
jgi:hypothetical protein